jgi:hypothetical protein
MGAIDHHERLHPSHAAGLSRPPTGAALSTSWRGILGVLLLLGSTVAMAAPSVIELILKERDYFLPAPAERSVVFKLNAKAASPKTRLMFKGPVAAGAHQYRFEMVGSRREQTFVIATPVAAGHSTFEVTIVGAGRFDFGFWNEGPDKTAREYRYTVVAPVEGRVLDVDFSPAKTIPPPAARKP